jgi:Protein of unknown function (DUF1479)
VVHAVECEHRGQGDSSVFYIPVVPLTVHKCVHYYYCGYIAGFLTGLFDQCTISRRPTREFCSWLTGAVRAFDCINSVDMVAEVFKSDFPGGKGESSFVGRGSVDDAQGSIGRRALGFEPFVIPDDASDVEADAIRTANTILS